MEVSVTYYLMVGSIIRIGIDISFIAVQGLAVYSKGGDIIYMSLACDQISLCNFYCFCSTVCYSSTKIAQLYRAGLQSTTPIGIDRSSICYTFNSILKVRLPVNSGRYQEGIGAGCLSASVVRYVGNACGLTCGRSTHGVCMLADQYTSALDQLVSCFLLSGLIVPGTGKGYIHGNAGAYGTSAQEEGGITGHNFCICISTYITHLSLIFGNITVSDHLIQLHACNDTCKVTTIINGSKCIVEIVQALSMSLGSGCMAELNIWIFLSSLNDVVLMSKTVCENEITTCISKLTSCFISFLSFRNVGLGHVLNTKLLTSCFCCIQEVQIISRVLIMQENETCLYTGNSFTVGCCFGSTCCFASTCCLGGSCNGCCICAGGSCIIGSASCQSSNCESHSCE